jgi:hypothetical protein
MSLEPERDDVICALASELFYLQHIDEVLAHRRAGLLSAPESQDALGIPVRYRGVMELAEYAVDDEALDRFERLGERWARGALTLNEFTRQMMPA